MDATPPPRVAAFTLKLTVVSADTEAPPRLETPVPGP